MTGSTEERKLQSTEERAVDVEERFILNIYGRKENLGNQVNSKYNILKQSQRHLKTTESSRDADRWGEVRELYRMLGQEMRSNKAESLRHTRERYHFFESWND